MPKKTIDDLKSMIGDSHRTVVDLRVEAGKVAEFARAVRDDDSVHYDQEAAAERGFDAVPAPLTFTRIGMFPRHHSDELGDETYRGFDLGLYPEHVIHGEQAYEYERPVLVGDVLTGTTTLTDVFRREGSRGGEMTFFKFETTYTDAGDELVLSERFTTIETDGAIDSEGGDD